MSVPYLAGNEDGTGFDGNIEISFDDLKHIDFTPDKNVHSKNIVLSELADFKDEGFLLHNVLSEKECQLFIDEGEKIGFETIRGVRDDYRNCKRITVNNEQLADTIWSRIQPYINDITIGNDPHAVHVHGPPTIMKGSWKPVGLNKIFRLCRYLPGGHFAPHFDGHYDKSPSERSLKTLMLYLNGNFKGGSTNFVDEAQTLYKDAESGIYCAEEKNIISSIQPETGLAIVFNHHRLHEGAQLKDGVKYILRTDVMFKNIDQSLNENYVKAISLLQQAETMENSGRCDEAAALYRRAFKLAPELDGAT